MQNIFSVLVFIHLAFNKPNKIWVNSDKLQRVPFSSYKVFVNKEIIKLQL